jgi:tRNA-2-methylthio-N6-dimethylallyladenosine synthase
MARLYTRDEYLGKIEALRKACPEISLSTDVIVGFPGETEEEFQDTLGVLRQVGFSQAYLFKYSPRPGTRAFAYEEEIPEPVKEDRLFRANEVLQAGIDRENLSLIGKKVPVLVEGLDKKKLYYTGRTPQWKLVHVLNAGDACRGKIIDVEITERRVSNLKGFYTGAPRVAREAHV